MPRNWYWDYLAALILISGIGGFWYSTQDKPQKVPHGQGFQSAKNKEQPRTEEHSHETLQVNETLQVKMIRDAYFADGILEARLFDGSRVDLLLADRAVEVDWAPKWAEGVGQALYYGRVTGRKATVLLLVKRGDELHFLHRALACGVDVWAYDVVEREWVNR